MVTTKSRAAGTRPSGRSAPKSRRPPTPTGKGRARATTRRPPAKPTAQARRRATGRSSAPRLFASVGSVFGSHAEDVWGIVLLTAAVLGALALYADALGPVGQGVRHGLGAFLGVGRFVVPLGCAGAGVILVIGPFEREKARVGVGLVLTVVAVSGLADIAGGAPRLTASWSALAGAGGWAGIAAGGPLRRGVGDWGASVVLVALLVLALVLFTGITLRRAAAAVAGAATDLFHVLVPEVDEETEDEPDSVLDTSDAGPPAVAVAPELFDLALPAVAPVPPEPDERAEPAAASAPVPDRQPVAAHGDLEVDLGMPAGEWRLPPPKILSRSKQQHLDHKEIAVAGRALVDALNAHGVATRLVGNTVGPTVTRFELELGPGVKVARVTSLAKDIAYAMASPDVRILAPIPGKSAIGVEVPNRRRQLVTLGDVLSSDEARRATHPLEVALGRDIAGRPVMASLAEMPHILISGATGAGKSSCINSLLTSILMRATPEQVRLILVDPKRVELGQYNGLPHLLTQVVVDPKKAANALQWAVTEMERRYDILAEAGMRDIDGYNEALDRDELDTIICGPEDEVDDEVDDEVGDETDDADDDERSTEDVPVHDTAPDVDVVSEAADIVSAAAGRAASRVAESRAVVDPPVHRERLPYVLVVVDELNDLMMVAARDVEESVCRIAQMARAVGIHLVLATQRPSVDVITGVIKANVPSRLAFSVSSLADSRVILDQPGAERLVGKGDMLLLTASSSVARRIQGPWVAETEVRSIVAHWRRQHQPQYVEGLAGDGRTGAGGGALDDEDDDLLAAAMELVVRSQLGSTSMLQRKLRVGFSRAGRLMDLLERRGGVGPSEGSKARAVLMTPEEFEQLSDR
ncbi:MAG TPA: DNA translocase FtsK [Acidimicrobiales bacterium]|nr:DNA translocase FtsK [Acidimicrobiales bacterium]